MKDGICNCDIGFAYISLVNFRYHGSDCKEQCPVYINGTEVLECNGHGFCVEDQGDWMCECDDGYHGLACDKSCPGLIANGNTTLECNGYGICSKGTSEEFTCTCENGYYGNDCSESCPGLIEVDGNAVECYGHGTCDQETLKCICSSDRYSGDGCECTASTCEHGKCNAQMNCECEAT